MTSNNQGSRKAPRPSRKNVKITPHKGGRTERFECRLAPIENQIITNLVRASGLSKSDWLMSVAQLTQDAPDYLKAAAKSQPVHRKGKKPLYNNLSAQPSVQADSWDAEAILEIRGEETLRFPATVWKTRRR